MNSTDAGESTAITSGSTNLDAFQKEIEYRPTKRWGVFSLNIILQVSLIFWVAGSQSIANVTPVANTGMTIPVSNGEKFTGFGKEPSQDYDTPGDVAFTATGSIPQQPGSASVVLIYSAAQQGPVAPPIAETDVPVSGIHFAWFGARLSFRHGRVAFLGGTTASTQGKANGLYSAPSPGTVNGIMGGSYFNGVVPYNGIANGAVDIAVQSAFSPSFDSNDPSPDLYWIYYNSDYEYENNASHYPVIHSFTATYIGKNPAPQFLQLNNLFSSVTLHADGGNIALYGGPGVSVLVAGALKTVANIITPDPSAATQPPGSQTFTSVVPSGSDASPGFQKSYITFWGMNSASGLSGIYFEDLGDMTQINPATAPLLVADTSMSIPGLTGTPKTFAGFDYQTCVDGSTIAFIGSKSNPPGSATPYDVKGIYVSQIVAGKPSPPAKVVDLTTPLDFGNGVVHTPTDLNIGHESLAGGQIVFWAQYDATHSGIFLAPIPSTSQIPAVTVQATDPTASTLGDTGTFVITRTGDTSSPLTVNYATSGTAVNGVSYQTLSGTVTILGGAGSAQVTVTPIDGCGQGEKAVSLSLNNNPNYSIGSPGTAVVTIQDPCSNPSPDMIITNYINHLVLVPSSTTVQAKYNDQDFGLVITSTTVGGSDAGGYKNVAAGLQVPPGYDIVGVRVCYVKVGNDTSINRIRIAQMQNPPNGYAVRLDDVTNLSDSGPVCHNSSATLVDPRGGVPQLYLGVTFSNTKDKIIIRGVALFLKKHIGP